MVFRKDYNEHKSNENELIDSSKRYIVGVGNVVDGESFRYLAEAGADFVKAGIGGGAHDVVVKDKVNI